MWSSLYFLWLLYVSNLAFSAVTDPRTENKTPTVAPRSLGLSVSALRLLLSVNATITNSAPVRWSQFDAPNPGAVVNVATERDVQITVQFCIELGIPFLAQNGGHGWIDNFNLEQNGIIINLRGLDAVTFNSDVTEVTLQGGALIEDVINAAYANNAQVLTGNCNCVGTLGAGLGGGYGNLLGIHGFSVDNILSMRVVLANGNLITVTPAQDDLFWALRGAAPNFGIVTSAVMRSYPVPQNESTAWLGGLFFKENQVEAIAEAIENLVLEPNMNIFLYFVTAGPPSFTPVVLVTPFYYGSAADGQAAFASILALGPFMDTTASTPYNEWNAGGDGFCVDGGRKPSYTAGLMEMAPATWRAIWNEWIAFLENPNTSSSIVLLEAYSLKFSQSIPASSSSFDNRDIRFNAAVIPWYNDSSLDTVAQTFGSKVRDLWRATSNLTNNRTYINFSHGDETNEEVYSASTTRLRKLKKQYDPRNVFSHWFDIAEGC